jgi:transaldolase
MPEATLVAVADHGVIHGDPVRGSYAAARDILEALTRVGVDIVDVANALEEQGIASFTKSWDELIRSVTNQIGKAGAVVMPAGAVKPAIGESSQDAAPAAAAPRSSTTKGNSPGSGGGDQATRRSAIRHAGAPVKV